MARSSCEPCCNPTELSRGKEMYQSATLQILCAVLEALEGGGGVGENVVVTEVTPGVAATNLGKAEDSPHASGDVGVEVLARRANTASSSTATDGDYATLNTDANGKLWTNAEVTVALPTGANTIGAIASIVAALPAGANTIGSVASITTSIVPGVAATNLGKAEDAPHVSGDTGVAVLVRRSDTASSSSTSDGDYSTLNTDSNGKLWVNSQVTAVVPGTAATSLGKAEDAASADGDTGVAAYGVRQDTIASSTTASGDYTPFKSDSVGALYTTPGTQPATFINQSGVYSTVTNSPATFLTNTNRLKWATFTSTLNQIIVWIDAASGTQLLYQLPGTQVTLDFSTHGRHVAGNIQVYYPVTAPNSGNLDVTAMF